MTKTLDNFTPHGQMRGENPIREKKLFRTIREQLASVQEILADHESKIDKMKVEKDQATHDLAASRANLATRTGERMNPRFDFF